jgi:predicted transcriptional regulator
MLSTREAIHQLVDRLPDSELLAAKRALERLAGRPSLAEFLANAPIEDEPISPQEAAATREGWADVAAGRVSSDEEIDREFGQVGVNP